jgi:hypothetical protein
MNQKSSLREDLKFVSWMLTGNTLGVAILHWNRWKSAADRPRWDIVQHPVNAALCEP